MIKTGVIVVLSGTQCTGTDKYCHLCNICNKKTKIKNEIIVLIIRTLCILKNLGECLLATQVRDKQTLRHLSSRRKTYLFVMNANTTKTNYNRLCNLKGLNQ